MSAVLLIVTCVVSVAFLGTSPPWVPSPISHGKKTKQNTIISTASQVIKLQLYCKNVNRKRQDLIAGVDFSKQWDNLSYQRQCLQSISVHYLHNDL